MAACVRETGRLQDDGGLAAGVGGNPRANDGISALDVESCARYRRGSLYWIEHLCGVEQAEYATVWAVMSQVLMT